MVVGRMFQPSCKLLYLVDLALLLQRTTAPPPSLHLNRAQRAAKASGQCLEFASYEASSWEQEWMMESEVQQADICGKMDEQQDLAFKWINDMESTRSSILHQPDTSVFSTFRYHNVCAAGKPLLHIPIEPAVGLLRHPFAYPCAQKGVSRASQVDVQDRRYLLVAPQPYISAFPGRKLLFDLGSGRAFDSSLQWLVESYQDSGVTWDEIWAWEVQETGPKEYWQTVPDDIVGKLHFYNTYASDHKGTPSPLGILKSRFSPGDFVVIKLDIDHAELESSIMQQLLAIRNLVSEIYFEMHFDAPEMRPFFGEGLIDKLGSTLRLFNKYRSAGVRLHYWP